MSEKTWFRIRISLFVFSFAAALFVPNPQIEELSTASGMDRIFLFAALAVIAVVIPFMVLAVLAFQAINPFSDKTWKLPTHHSNPFRLGNPLLFFHFAVYLGAAAGLGTVISSVWRGLFAAILGLILLVYSLSVLIGVRLTMRVFRYKMAAESSTSALPRRMSSVEDSTPLRRKSTLNFKKTILKLVGVVIILSSIFPIGLGVFLYLQSRNFLAKSITTTAIVSDLQHRGDVYYLIFSFTDKEGKEYALKSSSGSNPPAYKTGDTVSVLYDPKDPTEARTDSFFDLWLGPVLGVAMGIGSIIIGTVFVFIGRRKISEMETNGQT